MHDQLPTRHDWWGMCAHLVLGLQMRELSLRMSQLLLCLFQARKRFGRAGGVWYAVGLCTGLYLIQLRPSLDALFCCYFRSLLHTYGTMKSTPLHPTLALDATSFCHVHGSDRTFRQGIPDLHKKPMDNPPCKAQPIPRNHLGN